MRHDATVFLSGKDSIINAPHVRAYLQADGQDERVKGKGISIQSETVRANHASGDIVEESSQNGDGRLDVVWCADLDHGQVFDLPFWRKRLVDEVLA